MNNLTEPQIVAQLETVLAASSLIVPHRFDPHSLDVSDVDLGRGLSRLRAAIERLSSPKSPYVRDLKRIDDAGYGDIEVFQKYQGVAQSLLEDTKAGYTRNLQELIHGDVFADYLEMAAHLLESSYKDAAAVIAGSTLEEHLRNLCRKHGIDTERQTTQGEKQPKKADTLNSDLVANGVYTKLDQKNVTAWLDLRNKAAHGLYSEYSKEQVTIFLASVREFLARLPA